MKVIIYKNGKHYKSIDVDSYNSAMNLADIYLAQSKLGSTDRYTSTVIL